MLATAAHEDGDEGLLADIEGGKVHLAIRRYEALLNELFEQRRKFFSLLLSSGACCSLTTSARSSSAAMLVLYTSTHWVGGA